MEETLNHLYRQIAETVNEMIPEGWKKFYFYAQVSDDGGGTYFYYQPETEPDRCEHSLEIPFKYQVNEREFKLNKRKLLSLAEELRELFQEEGQELWYSFTLSLEISGSLKVHFDYTNWFDTNYSFSDQLIIWKYKYLKEYPQDVDLQNLIARYTEEFPDNPI
ncbi:immunity protein YezG family protein [Paenibacillus xylanexedens]|uniref:immunity protein YezG family protein n=1 Tax=Paenibacillus xylanexedens TaxID=528191 RepID=UPI0011A3B7FF|nr:immunity protein YezG family protein [Paenibacillus xylanexedens]